MLLGLGTPFRKVVEESILDLKRPIQIGIRGAANSDESLKYGPKHGIRSVYIEEVISLGVEKVVSEIRNVIGFDQAYVSFDIDSIDPSYAPDTGTLVIGGLAMREAQGLIRGLKELNIVDVDVVKVSPPFYFSGITALIAATITYSILSIIAETVV